MTQYVITFPARTMILTSALVNLFLAAYLTWTARVASDPDWGLGEAYADVLGPIWRIVTERPFIAT